MPAGNCWLFNLKNMPRKGKKQKKKLENRVSSWNKLPKITDTEAKGPNAKGTYYRKPGSLNK